MAQRKQPIKQKVSPLEDGEIRDDDQDEMDLDDDDDQNPINQQTNPSNVDPNKPANESSAVDSNIPSQAANESNPAHAAVDLNPATAVEPGHAANSPPAVEPGHAANIPSGVEPDNLSTTTVVTHQTAASSSNLTSEMQQMEVDELPKPSNIRELSVSTSPPHQSMEHQSPHQQQPQPPAPQPQPAQPPPPRPQHQQQPQPVSFSTNLATLQSPYAEEIADLSAGFNAFMEAVEQQKAFDFQQHGLSLFHAFIS